jgi:hypothetical protein
MVKLIVLLSTDNGAVTLEIGSITVVDVVIYVSFVVAFIGVVSV